MLEKFGRPDKSNSWGRFGATVKLDNKELFDKEQIGIIEPFPVTNLPFTL